jgi:mRNA interferase MazF
MTLLLLQPWTVRISVQKGEIWLINLDPTVGAEIRKTRPAVIASDDAIGILPLKVIVPITDWKDRYAVAPWMVRLEPDATNGLEKSSAADAFQVRSVSQTKSDHIRLVRCRTESPGGTGLRPVHAARMAAPP